MSLGLFREAHRLNPQHLGARLEIGRLLRELGRFDQAESTYIQILAKHGEEIGAAIGLALTYRAQNDRARSLATLKAAAERVPANTKLLLEIAEDLRHLDRAGEACDMLERIIADDPNSFDALLALGHARRKLGDLPGSLAQFLKAAALKPNHAGAKLQAAQDLRELGRPEEAEALLTEILARDPDNFSANMGLGHIARQRGDRTSSLGHFRRAAALAPREINPKLQCALDLRELGHLAEAIDAVESVVSLDPTNANAHAQLGQLYRARGNHQKARDAYARAVDCDPDRASFKVDRANCDRELGKPLAAEADLVKVLAAHPDDIQAAVSLAGLLIDASRLEEAKAVLDRIENQNSSAAVLSVLGRLARKADQRADALVFFQRAREIEPKNPGPLLELVREHREQGRFDEAFATNEILIGCGAPLQALLNRGRICRDRGERNQAIEAFKLAAAKFPEAWQAQLELAVEHRMTGRPLEAERILRSILEANDENLQALEQLIEFLRMAERFDEALQYCLKAKSLRPDIHWPYVKAAHVAARLGQRELIWKLLDEAERSIATHPEIVAARIDLLRSLRQLGQAEELAGNLQPEHCKHFVVGVQTVHSAIGLGQLELARERLARLQPSTARARSTVCQLKARISEHAWDHESAIAQYELSLDADRHNAGTYNDLARCNLLLFRASAALAHLRKSSELHKSADILLGRSHNSSQSHMGELINEFLLDSDLLAELASLYQLDGTTRLGRLADLVRENPDHTPSAIGFLVELRKAGRLSVEPGRSAELRIPRSIVQFWDSPTLPDDVREVCATWSGLNPGFDYKIFNERSAASFLREQYPAEVHAAFRASREPAQKADLFRLAHLAAHGGFYADCDDRCSGKLDEFIPSSADFVAYQEEFGTLGNNFIGATANHPVIRRALDLAVEAINRNDKDVIWLLTGPGLLTRAYASVAAEDPNALLSRSAIFSAGEIQRCVERHCPLGYKLTNQHWLRSAFVVQRRRPGFVVRARTAIASDPMSADMLGHRNTDA